MEYLRTLAAVAALTLAAVGCSAFEVADDHDGDHDSETTEEAHDHPDTPPIDGAPSVTITGTSMAFDPDGLTFTAGEQANLELTSDDIRHDLTIDELDFHVAAEASGTRAGGVTFDEPGTYIGYCSVPGHRQAGMELEITVE